MNTLKTIALTVLTLALFSCGGDKKTDSIPSSSTTGTASETPAVAAESSPDANKYDP